MNHSQIKKRIICLISVAFAVVVCLSLFSITMTSKLIGAFEENDNNEVTQSKYTVCAYNDRIAVFAGEDKTPVEVYDVFVNSLPREDAEAVNEGIRVEDELSLATLIEDLTS